MPSLPYRPDIDGLRAIAVLAVVLYHLGVPGLAGGFTGVDIFFVISGFLITQILHGQLRAGTFSLAAFYVRRIKRILPALTVVLLASAVAAWLLLLPTDATRFGESLGAAALFAANHYFLEHQGYFVQAAAEQSSLLHLWSLAVEEQFYLLFPWLLAGCVLRWSARPALWLAVLAGTSLAFALALNHFYSANAAFLLGPARGWELLAGGLLALRAPVLPAPAANACGAAGIALLAVAITGVAQGWPAGLAVVVPCAGAALLLAGSQGTWAGRLLALRPLVFVGLISYSLYLWHWPVLVFWRALRPLQEGGEALVFGASLLLAVLSWRWVEQPMRGGGWSPRRVFLTAGASVAVVLLVAAVFVGSGGGAWRHSAKVRMLDSFLRYDDGGLVRADKCFLIPRHVDPAKLDRATCLPHVAGKPDWLVVGDSHAAHIWHGLAQVLPEVSVQQATASGCKPVLPRDDEQHACAVFMREVLGNAVALQRPQVVVLSARWGDAMPARLLDTVQVLQRTGARVIVLGPSPEYRDALPRLLALAESRGDPSIVRRGAVPLVAERDALLEQQLRGSGAIYVSVYRALCDLPSGCLTSTPDGVPLQFDYGHFTREGSVLLAQRLRLMRVAGPRPPD